MGSAGEPDERAHGLPAARRANGLPGGLSVLLAGGDLHHGPGGFPHQVGARHPRLATRGWAFSRHRAAPQGAVVAAVGQYRVFSRLERCRRHRTLARLSELRGHQNARTALRVLQAVDRVRARQQRGSHLEESPWGRPGRLAERRHDGAAGLPERHQRRAEGVVCYRLLCPLHRDRGQDGRRARPNRRRKGAWRARGADQGRIQP